MAFAGDAWSFQTLIFHGRVIFSENILLVSGSCSAGAHTDEHLGSTRSRRHASEHRARLAVVCCRGAVDNFIGLPLSQPVRRKALAARQSTLAGRRALLRPGHIVPFQFPAVSVLPDLALSKISGERPNLGLSEDWRGEGPGTRRERCPA